MAEAGTVTYELRRTSADRTCYQLTELKLKLLSAGAPLNAAVRIFRVYVKLRLLGCIWTAVQNRGLPDGWRLEGTGIRGRLLAAKGEGVDKIIRSLVKIVQVEKSGRAEVLTLTGTDEFLQQPAGSVDRLVAEAIQEADLRPRR